MKRILILAALFLGITQVSAQERILYPIGGDNSTEQYNPTTTVWVDLRVTKTETIVGPYARYAQKFLGITVPVANKVKWEIIGAQLAYKLCPIHPETAPQTPISAAPEATKVDLKLDDNGFNKIGIDRLSSELLSNEDMARQAAERIFEIRKYRYDLITGELGEPILGAGLETAIEELTRMEDELVELFVGRQVINSETIRYEVDASRKISILCRFNEAVGIMSCEEFDGAPVVVKFSPLTEEIQQEQPAEEMATKKGKGAVDTYIMAETMQTTVLVDKVQLTKLNIPVFQQGKTIEYPAKR